MSKIRVDLSWQRFGMLTALEDVGKNERGSRLWLCICDCGNFREVSVGALKQKNIRSCGCRNKLLAINRGTRKDNKSGHKGVSWNQRDEKFYSYIYVNKKMYSLGQYEEYERAVEIREEAEKHVFEDFLEWYGSVYEKIKNSRNYKNSRGYKNSRNKSGHIGVFFNKKTKKFQVTICVNRKNFYIGDYENFDDAVQSREEAEKHVGDDFEYWYKHRKPRKYKVNDISGQRFGKLTVIRRDKSAPSGRSKWICKCDCGNTVSVLRNHLVCGQATSCGCAKKHVNLKDETGKRFGRLTVLSRTEKKSGNTYIYKCQCDCGNVCEVSGANLRNGKTKSCGCLASESHRKVLQDDGKARSVRNDYYVGGTDVMALCRGTQKNNTSGYRGVCWDESVRTWKSYIGFQGKRYYLGSSIDFDTAVNLRKKAEKKLHGEFLEWYAETYPEQWAKIKSKA